MPEVRIRKITTAIEEIHHEGGPPADRPLLRGAAMAVIENPFAGQFVQDLTPLIDIGEELGRSAPAVRVLVERARAKLRPALLNG